MEESKEEEKLSKEELMNKIIAAGLNSLSIYTSDRYRGSQKQKILLEFSNQYIDKYLDCFKFLEPEIKIFLFEPHAEKFLEFLKSQ